MLDYDSEALIHGRPWRCGWDPEAHRVGWRRQHAQCVWQAMQAVVAFGLLKDAMLYGRYFTTESGGVVLVP